MKTNPHRIEPLEARIAPASAFVTYADIDGDIVKITASKPGAVAPPLDAADLSFVGGSAAGQLAVLSLTDPGFEGAKIVFTVSKKPGGDGLANVGSINAAERSLDQVIVKGDLGRIIVGDAATTDDTDLKLLSVRSLGALGLVTGAPDLASIAYGQLGALKVAGDFTDARLSANGAIGSVFIGGNLAGSSDSTGRITSADGIGSVRIVGSLIGGIGDDSGQIVCNGVLGSVQIGRDFLGGSGDRSGRIDSGTSIGLLKIGGDLAGGGGEESGSIRGADALGTVRIGGDMIGGAGDYSGRISSAGEIVSLALRGSLIGGAGVQSASITTPESLGAVTIGGSLVGGPASYSGHLSGSTGIGSIKIGGDLRGGSFAGTGGSFGSGMIWSLNGRIGGVTIGGSLIAGTQGDGAILENSGAIHAGDDLGPVKIGGSIIGNTSQRVLITAEGQAIKPTMGFDTTIASLTVGGDVRFASILAGFDFTGTVPGNADASIGAVSVGRSWVASNLVAGAKDAGGDGFGINDTVGTFSNTGLIARIASIAIKGSVTGSLAALGHFGFVAQEIGSFKAAGFTAPLLAATANQTFAIPFTSDVGILEV